MLLVTDPDDLVDVIDIQDLHEPSAGRYRHVGIMMHAMKRLR